MSGTIIGEAEVYKINKTLTHSYRKIAILCLLLMLSGFLNTNFNNLNRKDEMSKKNYFYIEQIFILFT